MLAVASPTSVGASTGLDTPGRARLGGLGALGAALAGCVAGEEEEQEAEQGRVEAHRRKEEAGVHKK